ncbi:nitrilase-related carbon-nitrogen hydrolase [Dermatobacter hominis]|uniref:nitrilase-related carbon-nitrogen hydrolase n=1 Tax=Dermatobacter hominis TaxID=2884263 RepID=UPI001D12BE6F|nr:nitrilase-related carbon-nitrogen hydrolase [Dermatobacter hominis]UDY37366.1 hydrolase [Dermatobacter hominis]
MRLITADHVPDSPARTRPPERAPWRVAAVQHRWHADAEQHAEALADGVATAAGAGAHLVCLQELTLSPYFAALADGPEGLALDGRPVAPEDLRSGPTRALAERLAVAHGVFVSASLWEADPAIAPRGWNTQVCVGPDGALVAATRKVHIPVTEGYREDLYFPPGAPDAVDGDLFPVADLSGAAVGFPTCWDQWFPELARAYSLGGAEVLVYPTAIGSEPDHPGFDTQPLWQQVIVGNGIANGTFMVAVNRVGTEQVSDAAPRIEFYGSSFISDPYGRVLVQAPRHEPAVIVADLDLDARRDWLELFPFLTTRRPEAYGVLTSGRWGAANAGSTERGT